MEPQLIDPNDLEALKRRIAELEGARQANPSGAAAQGGGNALGRGAVQVEGDNAGAIITGTQIVNHYHAASDQRLTKEQIAR